MAAKDEGGLAPLLLVGGLLVGLWWLAKNRAAATRILPGAVSTVPTGYTGYGTGITSSELNPALSTIATTAVNALTQSVPSIPGYTGGTGSTGNTSF